MSGLTGVVRAWRRRAALSRADSVSWWAEERGMLVLTLADLRHRLRRFVTAGVATTLVFSLLLLMTSIVREFSREGLVTISGLGADHWVVPDGSGGVFTSTTVLPGSAVDEVHAPAVAPFVLAMGPLDGYAYEDVMLVGYRAGSIGSPSLTHGRDAVRAGEVVVSDRAGFSVGDRAVVNGLAYDVVGVARDATILAGMPLVFLTVEQAQQAAFAGQPVISAVLTAGALPILPDGLVALTPEEVAADVQNPLDRAVVTLNLVRGLLWVVAAMIIGAVVYLSSLDRLRDLAVLRAIGTSPRSLAATVAVQGVLVAILAAVIAALLQPMIRPVFPLPGHLSRWDYAQLPIVATGVAILASLTGIRRSLRIPPALAFSTGPT